MVVDAAVLYVLYGSAAVPDTGLKLPEARMGAVSLGSTSQKYSGSNTSDRQLHSINVLVGNLASMSAGSWRPAYAALAVPTY